MRFLTNNALLPERQRLQKRSRFVMANPPDSPQKDSVNSSPGSQAERKAKWSGAAVLGVFAFFWCGLVGVFDCFAIPAFIRQFQSNWYESASAQILHSELKSNSDSDGTTYGVKVSYRYTVNGQEYTSDLYTFDKMSSSDSAWARAAVRENPAGSERVCYYDPSNPSRAILKPGIDGNHVFLLMFLTPFNMIGLALLWGCVSALKGENFQPKPRRIDRFQNRENFLMSRWTPFGVFLTTFGLGTFLGIFVVALPGGFHPSLTKVFGVWGAVVALALIAAVRSAVHNASGQNDLVLDHNNKTLTLPKSRRAATQEIFPYAYIRKIEARTIKTGSGDDEKTEHKIFLFTKDGAEHLLKEEFTETRATRLAETLSQKLGLS